MELPPHPKTVPCACRPPSSVHTHIHSSLFIPRRRSWGGRKDPGLSWGADSRDPLGKPCHPKERRSPCDAKAVPICSAWVTPVAIFIGACLQGSGRFILSPLS